MLFITIGIRHKKTKDQRLKPHGLESDSFVPQPLIEGELDSDGAPFIDERRDERHGKKMDFIRKLFSFLYRRLELH